MIASGRIAHVAKDASFQPARALADVNSALEAPFQSADGEEETVASRPSRQGAPVAEQSPPRRNEVQESIENLHSEIMNLRAALSANAGESLVRIVELLAPTLAQTTVVEEIGKLVSAEFHSMLPDGIELRMSAETAALCELSAHGGVDVVIDDTMPRCRFVATWKNGGMVMDPSPLLAAIRKKLNSAQARFSNDEA